MPVLIRLTHRVTGYQEARERDALAKILEAFIAKELQPYIRTFEADYYKAICKLKGWEFKASSRRPRALAQITNDIVYSRLAPGVLDKLREKNPVVKAGGRRAGGARGQQCGDGPGAGLGRVTRGIDGEGNDGLGHAAPRRAGARAARYQGTTPPAFDVSAGTCELRDRMEDEYGRYLGHMHKFGFT